MGRAAAAKPICLRFIGTDGCRAKYPRNAAVPGVDRCIETGCSARKSSDTRCFDVPGRMLRFIRRCSWPKSRSSNLPNGGATLKIYGKRRSESNAGTRRPVTSGVTRQCCVIGFRRANANPRCKSVTGGRIPVHASLPCTAKNDAPLVFGIVKLSLRNNRFHLWQVFRKACLIQGSP